MRVWIRALSANSTAVWARYIPGSTHHTSVSMRLALLAQVNRTAPIMALEPLFGVLATGRHSPNAAKKEWSNKRMEMIRRPTQTFENDRMKYEVTGNKAKVYQNVSPTIEGKQIKVTV
jgi:hypothetical protein